MFTWWQFVLVFVIISFVISGIINKIVGFDLEEFFAVGFGLSFLVFIVYLLITGLGCAISTEYFDEIETKYYYKDKEYLLTLQDETESNTNLSGSYINAFAIGVGSISSSTSTEKYYYTMSGTNEEGYILKKYNCENTYLFFDEEEKPYVQIKRKSYVIDYKNNWLFGGLLKPLESEKKYETIKTELHVPKNTIKIKYDVDLK